MCNQKKKMKYAKNMSHLWKRALTHTPASNRTTWECSHMDLPHTPPSICPHQIWRFHSNQAETEIQDQLFKQVESGVSGLIGTKTCTYCPIWTGLTPVIYGKCKSSYEYLSLWCKPEKTKSKKTHFSETKRDVLVGKVESQRNFIWWSQ